MSMDEHILVNGFPGRWFASTPATAANCKRLQYLQLDVHHSMEFTVKVSVSRCGKDQ
jgi:hypothetical protein